MDTALIFSGVTYNVFLGRTFDPLFTWLYNSNPLQDLYCFQEFPEDKLDSLRAYVKKEKYGLGFAAGFRWHGRTYGEVTLYNKDKLTLDEMRTLPLGGKGERTLVFIHEGAKMELKLSRVEVDRTALLTSFRYRDQQVCLVNAHLFPDVYNARKLRQLTKVMEALPSSVPAIVLGDFNYPFGRGLTKLAHGAGFASAFEHLKTFRFAPGLYWQNDYILQRDCVAQITAMKRVSHSDHYPLFFDVILQDTKGGS